METHLMLGRVDVYIHLMGIDLQIQHKRRLLIGPQLVFTGLADSMVDQPIAHHPPVNVAILNFRQRRGGMQRIGDPAAQGQIAMLPLIASACSRKAAPQIVPSRRSRWPS